MLYDLLADEGLDFSGMEEPSLGLPDLRTSLCLLILGSHACVEPLRFLEHVSDRDEVVALFGEGDEEVVESDRVDLELQEIQALLKLATVDSCACDVPDPEYGLEDQLVSVALLHNGSSQVPHHFVSLLEHLDLAIEVTIETTNIDFKFRTA